MRTLLIAGVFALGVSACMTPVEEAEEAEVMATEMDKTEDTESCPILNPDGSCACEKVDEFGECVEGGGTGVIVIPG